MPLCDMLLIWAVTRGVKDYYAHKYSHSEISKDFSQPDWDKT